MRDIKEITELFAAIYRSVNMTARKAEEFAPSTLVIEATEVGTILEEFKAQLATEPDEG